MDERFDQLMMGVSGARGRVDNGFTPETVSRLAAAFGSLLERGDVLVARDSRTTGDALVMAVNAGLCSVGCTPLSAGLLTTPAAQVSVGEVGCAGGIMVTASHNPAPWNGLKFMDSSGAFVSASGAQEIYQRARSMRFPRASWEQWPSVRLIPSCSMLHLNRIMKSIWVDVSAIRKRGIRLVVDCNHGASGPLIRQMGIFLDLKIEILGLEPTGRFRHEPEPRPENLADLGAAVRKAGADLGAALDPDGDRLVLCTDDGETLTEEATLPIVADAVLSRHRGIAVTNLSTSSLLETVAERHGGRVVRTPVGEAHVVQGMKANDAVIGGEGNGGVIIPTIHYGRDATAGLALILSRLATADIGLRDFWNELPRFSMKKSKVSLEGRSWATAVADLEQAFESDNVDKRDGIRIAWPGAWVHIRPSNTEPVVRVVAESARREETERLVETAENAVRKSTNG